LECLPGLSDGSLDDRGFRDSKDGWFGLAMRDGSIVVGCLLFVIVDMV